MENVAATGTTDKKLEQYYQNYFSGEQCRMYFSTDQTGENAPGFNFIEYSINSNKSPVYGYGDKYYRIVANGNYLVQGRMGFNLTSKDRLNKIFSATIPAGITQSNASLVIREGRNPSLGDISDVINSKSLDGAMLNAVREAYKKLYWGTESGIKRYRFDEMDLDENGDVNPRGFDITLIFGYPYGTYSQYFVKTITSAHILGESMQVTDDGRNTLIVFDYFARAVDDAPTTYDKLTINAEKLGTPAVGIPQDDVDTSKFGTNPNVGGNYIPKDLEINLFDVNQLKGKVQEDEVDTTPKFITFNITDIRTIKSKTAGYWELYFTLTPPQGVIIVDIVTYGPGVGVIRKVMPAKLVAQKLELGYKIPDTLTKIGDLGKYLYVDYVYNRNKTIRYTTKKLINMSGIIYKPVN